MKLREVQKALGLHYLNLNVAIEAFDAHGLRGQNDKLLDVPDMITGQFFKERNKILKLYHVYIEVRGVLEVFYH